MPIPYLTLAGYNYRTATRLVLLLIMSCHNVAYARTGDELIVTGSIVNLRAEPSLQARVLLRVAQGHKLIEISRYQDWVEVATRRSEVDTGWIHASLLQPAGGEDGDSVDPAYTAFLGEFNRVNASLAGPTEGKPFLGVEQITPGELRITAAAPWFSLGQSRREAILSDLFNFWQQQNDVGSGVSLEVVDEDRQPHMMIFK